MMTTTHPPSLLPVLQMKGLGNILSSKSESILADAQSTKQISTHDLGSILVSNSKNGAMFSIALKMITNVFSDHGIRVVYTPVPTKLSSVLIVQITSPFKREVVRVSPQEKIPPAQTAREKSKKVNINSQDIFILTANQPVLSTKNVDKAVEDNAWYDRTLEEALYSDKDLLTLYMSEVSKHKVLKTKEEKELMTLILQGDLKAKEKFILSNLRLVVWCAIKFKAKLSGHPSFELMDLIQEGNRGLLTAVERFDPGRGFKFSTYAPWWIKSFISRSLYNESREIRLPVHVGEKITKYKKTYSEVMAHSGVPVDLEKVAEIMKITLEDVHAIRRIVAQGFDSLDNYQQENDSERPQPFILDPGKMPDETYNEKQLQWLLIKSLRGNLSPKEYEIYVLRHGLDGNAPHILEEVGKKFNVTRERIRQIEDKALKKLQHNPELISLALSMNFKVEKSLVEKAREIVEEKNIKQRLDIQKEVVLQDLTQDNTKAIDLDDRNVRKSSVLRVSPQERSLQRSEIINHAGGFLKLNKLLSRIKIDEKVKAMFITYYDLGVFKKPVDESFITKKFRVSVEQLTHSIFMVWKKLKESGCEVIFHLIEKELKSLNSK